MGTWARRGWAALCVLGAVLGCASPEAADPRTRLVLWHSYRGAEVTALEASVQRFEASHPALRVSLVSIPYDAFPNKVTVATPRGNGPDLFIFAHDRVGDWAATGIVEPIGFWATEPLLDRFFRATLAPLVYRGQLFGLPLAFKTLALYRDTSLAPTAPASTEALVSQAQAARAKDPSVWGLAYELDSLYFHAPWLHGFGGSVYADDADTVALDSPAAVASVAFVRRLVAEAKIIPDEVTSALVTTLFKQRKLAYVLSGPWFRSELDGHDGWAVSPLPVVSETGLKAKPFLGVEAVLLSAHGQHKRAAFELMTFLSDDSEALARLTEGGQLVANRAPYDAPAVAQDAFVRAFRAQVEDTVSLSNRPHMRGVWTPMKAALSQAIVHGKAPKAALTTAVQAIERGAK